jgi:hypothetical protein
MSISGVLQDTNELLSYLNLEVGISLKASMRYKCSKAEKIGQLIGLLRGIPFVPVVIPSHPFYK